MNENTAHETQSQLVSSQLTLWDVPRRPKPDVVPFARNSETSRESAELKQKSGSLPRQRRRIVEQLAPARGNGLTIRETAQLMDCLPSDLNAGFQQLREAGAIVQQGTRKHPLTGKSSAVYVLPEFYRGVM